MNNIEYLKDIIKNRTCCILLHGNSIQELELHIDRFSDKDICWCSLGVFDIFETYILSKINKELDFVFDCATVPHSRIEHYEKYSREPRLTKYLERSANNAWITSNGIIRDSVKPYYPELLDKFSEKIMIVDSFFPQNEIAKWMDVPNSVTLLIASCLAGNAKNIIIFGLDGYNRDTSKGFESYYKPEHVIKERQHALGSVEDAGINRDTNNFAKRFPFILNEYRTLFHNMANIYNCSPKSLYKIPQKINYTELELILNESSRY